MKDVQLMKLKWLLKNKSHWYSNTRLSQDGKVWESMGLNIKGKPVERELKNWRDAVDMEECLLDGVVHEPPVE